MTHAKREQRVESLLQLLSSYVEGDQLYLWRLRTEHPQDYAKLPYYFGGVAKAIATLEQRLGKSLNVIRRNQSDLKTTQLPNYELQRSLRNRLAYEYLAQLRKEYTYEEIADYYGCTRALVSQLWQSLDKLYGVPKSS